MADDDIYRDFSTRPRSPSIQSLSSSTSSSASFPARLGALAAVVEHAITRWARRRRLSSSSSTSSSSSSRSSALTNTRSFKRARRSPSFLSANTEREFTAHVALVKARKESRQVSRQFSLYLPPSLLEKRRFGGSQRLTTTASLPLVLNQLDLTLKHPLKARRAHEKSRLLTTPPIVLSSASSAMYVGSGNEFATVTAHKTRKGKGKANSLPTLMERDLNMKVKPRLIPKAWYLDVASPSWEDLRAIGKLLHLHPLTLEDILQKEPREKLELFPKLGYYFVSFRAIETRSSRDITRRQDLPTGEPQPHEPSLAEANVYLTVFRDGICSFHFTDMSGHTDRIRNRIHHLEGVFNMTSDWIAHGLLDSIVDSFFPYLEQIDKEVVAIEKLVFSRHDQMSEAHDDIPPLEPVSTACPEDHLSRSGTGQESDEKIGMSSEKVAFEDTNPPVRPATRLSALNLLGRFRRLWSRREKVSSENLTQNSKDTLRRIARTRRLVTSLSRLLATKSDVMAQIRKRLLTDRHFREGAAHSQDTLDVAIYMGDVQDHILTLQHSLVHYERMLSQLHPTYLSQLRTDAELTKSGRGKALLYFTVITVAGFCIQTYVGILSLNVYVPQNAHVPSGSYHVLVVAISIIVVILLMYSVAVRRWWEQATRRHRTRL